MKSLLWIAALLLAAGVGVLTQTNVAWAGKSAAEVEEDEKRTQEVREVQIKYASYGTATIVIAAVTCWLLSQSNKRKKDYAEIMRKQERLADEGEMPLS